MVSQVIFDLNLDAGFTRKTRFVVDRKNVDTAPFMMFVSVLSRDSVQTVLMLAAINVLGVRFADVQNAYLNANFKERVYFQNG